jgi:hypothetical protein
MVLRKLNNLLLDDLCACLNVIVYSICIIIYPLVDYCNLVFIFNSYLSHEIQKTRLF